MFGKHKMKKSKKITKISAPYAFEQGIKITTNKDTGKYDGVPRGFLGVVPRSCVNSFLDDRNVPHDLIPCSCSCTEGIRLHAQSMKGPHPELLLSQDNESAMSNEEIRHEWVPLKDILKLHDPTQGLTDMSLIATGGCGEIYKANMNGTDVAVKKVSLSTRNADRVLAEVEIMANVRHPNLVRMIEAGQAEKTLWTIMEYIDGATLTYLTVYGHSKETHIAYFAREILKALKCLHNNRIMHRDIKSDNIMVTEDGRVKLIDLGFGAYMKDDERGRMSVLGTPNYMAPELIKGNLYTYAVDVWSVGVVCWELACGEPPYMDRDPVSVVFEISTCGLPPLPDREKWTPTFLDFLDSCLEMDPARRATVDELLEHPFLRQACHKSSIPALLQEADQAYDALQSQ